MKKRLFSTILALLPLLAFTQYFEGVALYQNGFDITEKMKKRGMNGDSLFKKMVADGNLPSEYHLEYKSGNYRITRTDGNGNHQIYRTDSNKLFTFFDGADICQVTDATVDVEAHYLKTKPTVQLLDTSVMVYEKACKIVRVKWKSGVYDYYFSPGFLPIDPKVHEPHIYDGWSEFAKIAKAYPLKIVKSSSAGIITATISKVEMKKVDDAVFKLPKLVPHEELKSFIPGQQMMKKVRK